MCRVAFDRGFEVLSQHRIAELKRYKHKALASGALTKVIRDPAILVRAVKTFATNRNLREVPPEELLRDAESSVHALSRLASHPAKDAFADWLPVDVTVDVEELGELFRKHGSDKSTEHDYFEVYGSILAAKRSEPIRILEIGLGTNNLAYQSNMGLGGRPGASLRAFRDWASKADVIGADIDREILFEEDRLRTWFVDQTDSHTLQALASQVGPGFDLIIDDGLHLPNANLNSIEALLPLLKSDGTMVVEDIDPIHLHYWQVASAVMAGYDTYLTERRGGYIFVIRYR